MEVNKETIVLMETEITDSKKIHILYTQFFFSINHYQSSDFFFKTENYNSWVVTSSMQKVEQEK